MPPERRGLALGIWGGIGGLAVALGPLVGGAIVSGISWHWIFWLNVPIGLVLAPLAYAAARRDAAAPTSSLDLPGLALASAGLLGIVWGLVRGNDARLDEPRRSSAPLVVGAAARRRVRRVGAAHGVADAADALLPQPHVRARRTSRRCFMFFGMFGSIFLLAQFFQTVQGYSPLQSGLRILPWTAMPIFIAPIAGALSDRIGGQRADGARASRCRRPGSLWIAAISTPTTPYIDLVVPFVLSGVGMALFFAPVANVVLPRCGRSRRARRRARTTRSASSAASSASRCWPRSSRTSAATRRRRRSSHGMTTAVYVGGALVALGAVAAALIKRRRRGQAERTELAPVVT